MLIARQPAATGPRYAAGVPARASGTGWPPWRTPATWATLLLTARAGRGIAGGWG